MQTPQNAFKRRLLAKELQIGLWCSLGSNIAAEIVGDSGFDWMLLDTEHAPNEPPDVLAQLQAFATGTAQAVVRPAWNDAVLIKRLLDIGAQTLLVPFVQNAEEARRAVAACRYPPAGIRGITTGGRASRYGRAASYLKEADQQVCLLVQAETLGGNRPASRRSPPSMAWMASSSGRPISARRWATSAIPLHPDVQRAIEAAAKRINDAGKVPGILTAVEADARRYIEWGYRFVAVGTDIGLLARNADALAAAFRKK